MHASRAGVRRALRPVVVLTACAATALTAGAGAAAPGTGARSVLAPTAPTPDDPRWRVVEVADGSYEVSWTAPRDLPVRSDRPTIVGDGLAFGPPTVAGDGRTVTASVTADAPPDPADLDVLLSGDRLDEAGFDPGQAGRAEPLPERVTTLLDAPDPGRPGPFPTVTSDYDWDPVQLPGMEEPIEMVGHVVEPAPGAATGPRPLVLLMHGRHEYCYDPTGDGSGGAPDWPCPAPLEEIPSHLGYDYLQQLLASQGFTTVSVRVNGINAQDWVLPDGGADARADIVQEHLDGWVDLAATHQVDLEQVVLVGHSRGGEGVDRAAIQIGAAAPYTIVGQVLLAPTDFAWHTAPYVPTVTVLPYCDGDVSDLQGQRFTDVARDLAIGDTSLKSSVMVLGANHNYFNTEWTPATAVAPAWDDWGGERGETCGVDDPGRLKAWEQRQVGKAYVAGAVHLFTGATDYAPLYDGSPVTVGSVGDAEVLTHAIGGGRSVRRPGSEARPTLGSGTTELRLCSGVSSFAGTYAQCGRRNESWLTPHWVADGEQAPARQFLELAWDAAGATGGLRFSSALDLTSDRLEIRTILDPTYDVPELSVRITDSSGASADLEPVAGTQPFGLPVISWATKLWATTVAVDASAAAGVDLADVTSVEVLPSTPQGRLWVADVAAAPALPPAAQAERLPRVSVDTVEIDEGDDGTQVVRVPFTIAGDVERPARFLTWVGGQERGQTQRFVVDVAPGQTTGSIPVEYEADDRFGFDQQFQIAIFPLRGVATDGYLGGLTVLEDEPAPDIDVQVTDQVHEGGRIRVTVRVDGDRSIPFFVYGLAVRGPGEDLRGADVPRDWLRGHADARHPERPLWRLFASVFGELRPRRDTVTLTIPTRDDRAAEGREHLYLRVQVGENRSTRHHVTVVDDD